MKNENNHPIELILETTVLLDESEATEIEGGKDETGSCRTKTCDFTNQDIYYL